MKIAFRTKQHTLTKAIDQKKFAVFPLGASSYACATPHKTMADWLDSKARALRLYGGVPRLIVPDNPRAMIADANRYEPRGNDTVLDFARHYGTSILPARPYHPQDKAKAKSELFLLSHMDGAHIAEDGVIAMT